MKSLTLIRHAKSSHDNPSVRDIHRPLNGRGRRDAPAIGRHLDESFQFAPDLIISSPASRAIHTARMIAKEIGADEWGIRQDERIYEAPLRSLLQVVREVHDDFAHVALFGHNPGLETFCNWLCGEKVIDGLRTAGVMMLEVDTESWAAVNQGCAKLKLYLFPAMIGAGKDPED